MSSYPNVPLQRGNDWDRKVAQATNYLLNQLTFFQFAVEGQPTSGEVILRTRNPVDWPLVANQCSITAETAPTADAVVIINVAGSLFATATILAGQDEGTVAFLSSTRLPAATSYEIVMPTPQDATLADITLTLAASL
jgi:hypothetical protein